LARQCTGGTAEVAATVTTIAATMAQKGVNRGEPFDPAINSPFARM
jgi:hypothetical protein